jgi:hypothetical protein
MTARLTPIRVAERELQRLTIREDRLIGDLQAVRIDKSRWQSVLDALNGDDPDPEEDQS